MIVAVGVDLGKRKDPAAIVVTEYQPVQMAESGEWWPAGELPPEKKWTTVTPDTLYIVRSIEHVELGTSYPKIGRRISEICRNLRKRLPDAQIHLVMDATGVGAGPVDIVREILDPSILLTAVSYTATDKCPPSPLSRPECNVGKAYMVVRAQTTLQQRLLQMPKSPMTAGLVEELVAFEVKTSIAGRDSYNAPPGKHDDILNALLLSILGDTHSQAVRYGDPIYT